MAEEQSVHILSEDIRQAVIEECREQAKPHPLHVFLFIVFAAAFFSLGAFIFTLKEEPADRLLRMVWGTLFCTVPLLLAYMVFLQPLQILRMAERNEYEFRIGVLTAAEASHSDDATEYFMTLDGELKCRCSKKQFEQAAVGERYIAAFFLKGDYTELCVRIPGKDII